MYCTHEACMTFSGLPVSGEYNQASTKACMLNNLKLEVG